MNIIKLTAFFELFFAIFAYILWELKQNENKTTIHMKVTHAIQQKISLNIVQTNTEKNQKSV